MLAVPSFLEAARDPTPTLAAADHAASGVGVVSDHVATPGPRVQRDDIGTPAIVGGDAARADSREYRRAIACNRDSNFAPGFE